MQSTERDGAGRGPAEELAAEFVAERDAGRAPLESDYLSRLEPEQREAFRGLVEGAVRAGRAVPAPPTSSRVLSERYVLERQIGAGGMGRVFAAHDRQLGRQVAIKLLSAADVGDAAREELLLKESRLLAGLKHPNIVSVHEAARDGELFYLAMDLVEGRALSEVVERARAARGDELEGGGPRRLRSGDALAEAIGLPTPEGRPELIEKGSWSRSAAGVMLEVARTIEAAHARGVIHRDLKPSNVMLLGGGSPVVLDFGLAGTVNPVAGAVTQGLYGTVAYLAPEQARSRKVGSDPRTDVYQLGLMLYELLTLERAFPGESIGDVLDDVERGNFRAPRSWNPSIPRDLEAIVFRALERSPSRRFQTVRELRTDLERFLSGDELPMAARSSTLRRAVRRSRLLVQHHPLGAAAVCMALVALFTWGAAWRRASLDSWTSPVFVPWRMAPGNFPEHLVGGDPRVLHEDLLGADVSGARPSYVYALNQFQREPGGEVFLSPYQPELHEEFAAGRPAERSGTWDLRVDEDRQAVVCGVVDEGNATEGLILIASAQPSALFDEWLDWLFARSELGVGQDEAMRHLDELVKGTARGVPAVELTPEERQRYTGVAAAIGQRDGDWEIANSVKFSVRCRVEAP